MKIQAYSNGSAIQSVYSPVVRDTYLGEAKASSNKESSSKKENLLDKAIIKAVEESGIPSDRRVFLSQVYNFLSNSENVYGTSGVDGDINGTLSQLIAIQKMAGDLKYNQQVYNNTVSQLNSSKAGSDIALNSIGHLYVVSDGKLDTITLDTYKENPGEYQLLTNNQLLSMRTQNTALAGRTDILESIGNAVGMEDIMQTIEDAIEAFGEQKRKGVTIKASSEVQKGLEGLYKIDSSVSTAAASKESMLTAIKYLKNTRLNQNAKNVLAATAALNNTTSEQIIYDAITLHTDNTYNEDPDNGSGSSSGNGVDGKKLDSEISFGESVLKEYGMPKDFDMIIGGSLKFSTSGFKYDRIENSNEGPLPTVQTLSEAYENLQEQGIIATGKTTFFGNIPINNISAYGRDLLIDNAKGGTVAWLPVDSSGNLSFSIMSQMQKVQKSIEDQHITDVNKQKEIWENNGFMYDRDKKTGIPYGYSLAPFWIQDAYTSENTSAFKDPWLPGKGSILSKNEFVEKVEDSVLDQMLANYNYTHKNKKPLDISAGMTEDSYRGYIFIPINQDEKQAAIAAGHAYTPKADIRGVHARQQAAIHGGAYNNGVFNRTNNGTSASDLN